MKLKSCYKCGIEKMLDDFHRSSRSADGRQSACKDCQRIATRERQRADPEKHREHVQQSRKRNPDAARTSSAKQRLRDRTKVLARKKLSYAIERGYITRPSACDACGKPCEPHGHHADYSRPLEVKWLCPTCHGQEHSNTQL